MAKTRGSAGIADIETAEQLKEYLTDGRDRLVKLEKDYAMLRGAWGIVSRDRGGAVRNEAAAEEIGKFLKAVVRNDRGMIEEMGGSGGLPDLRAGEALTEKTLLGTPLVGDATTGSYTVPSGFLAEIQRIAEEQSDLFGLVRRIPMANRTTLVPVEDGTLDFHWVTAGEASGYTEDAPGFDQDTLTAYTAAAWLAISEELTEDSAILLGDYIATLSGEAWARAFEGAVLSDNGGVSPFTGLLNNGNVPMVTMSSGDKTFGDARMSYCASLIGALPTRAKRRGARFCAHPTVFDVLSDERDAQGQYVWRGSADALPTKIKGYPFTECDGMPAVSDSAVSTPFVVFGNFNKILFGDRIGVEVRWFGQTQNAVKYGVGYFRLRVRAGFACPLPAAFARLRTAAG